MKMKPYEITPALSPLLSPLPTSPSHTPTPALTLRSCDWSNIGPISFGNGGVNKRVTHSPWICQLLLLAQTERRGEEKRPLNFPSLENLIPGYGVGAASAHSHKTLSCVSSSSPRQSPWSKSFLLSGPQFPHLQSDCQRACQLKSSEF